MDLWNMICFLHGFWLVGWCFQIKFTSGSAEGVFWLPLISQRGVSCPLLWAVGGGLCSLVFLQWKPCSQQCVSARPCTQTRRTQTRTTTTKGTSTMLRPAVGNSCFFWNTASTWIPGICHNCLFLILPKHPFCHRLGIEIHKSAENL